MSDRILVECSHFEDSLKGCTVELCRISVEEHFRKDTEEKGGYGEKASAIETLSLKSSAHVGN